MRLSPLSPSLPKYPGPYAVGTFELELPLPEHLQKTFGDASVKTLLVRLFYPTHPTATGPHPRWVGKGDYTLRGYARFLGVSPRIVTGLSYLGLRFTELPAISYAPLADLPSPNDPHTHNKWPCMIFSHGLGGTRNAYSQICGSLASGGAVVCAVEHRDNSAAVSVVNGTDVVEYISIKETTPETIAKRRNQLAQRAYESCLAVEVLRGLNDAESKGVFRRTDLDTLPGSDAPSPEELAAKFINTLDCGPGRFIFAGHSFGAATAIHCCKTTESLLPESSTPLKDEFRAAVLLDPWMQVVEDSKSTPLDVPAVAVASEPFQKWSSNWDDVVHVLSPTKTTKNRLFWLRNSAHLSQSDFQLLFPTATRFAFKATIDPHLAMTLNIRIAREWLRSTINVGDEPPDTEIFNHTATGTHLVEHPLTS
ncbi:hypothetical protein PYCC9005_001816 [Savitreella phatthalungensis]